MLWREPQHPIDQPPRDVVRKRPQKRIDNKCAVDRNRFKTHLELEIVQPRGLGISLDGTQSIIDHAELSLDKIVMNRVINYSVIRTKRQELVGGVTPYRNPIVDLRYRSEE